MLSLKLMTMISGKYSDEKSARNKSKDIVECISTGKDPDQTAGCAA